MDGHIVKKSLKYSLYDGVAYAAMYIDKNISQKKEEHDITDMHEIEHITGEIEKGKRK